MKASFGEMLKKAVVTLMATVFFYISFRDLFFIISFASEGRFLMPMQAAFLMVFSTVSAVVSMNLYDRRVFKYIFWFFFVLSMPMFLAIFLSELEYFGIHPKDGLYIHKYVDIKNCRYEYG